MIAIATPVYRNYQKVGVLVGYANLEYITAILQEIKITDNSYFFMLNSDGTVSAHPDTSYVLKQNWISPEDSASKQTVDGMTQTQKNAIALMMERQTGIITGEDSVFVYAPVEGTDMVLCMVSPFLEAYEIIPKLFTSITMSVLFMVALGIIISLALAKSITDPFPVKEIREVLKDLLEYFEAYHGAICHKIEHGRVYSEELRQEIIDRARKFMAAR